MSNRLRLTSRPQAQGRHGSEFSGHRLSLGPRLIVAVVVA